VSWPGVLGATGVLSRQVLLVAGLVREFAALARLVARAAGPDRRATSCLGARQAAV